MFVLVQKSKIHSNGVFAKQHFNKGDTVLRWDTTKTISESTYRSLTENEKRYVEKVGVDYIVMQAPEKFVNHSCEPNLISRNYSDIALRDIEVGEELTINYLDTIPEGVSFTCNCQSENCIGNLT
ncbi:SET domain-containing protein-lysine N-methyltransferase [Patescibacteria group bacterium]|nr:SET domain-containing protein-lysine N-methyltransferase [Patescibacteria group bacterium]